MDELHRSQFKVKIRFELFVLCASGQKAIHTEYSTFSTTDPSHLSHVSLMRNTQHEHRASNCASINPLCSRALVILSSKRSAVMSLGVSSQMFNGALSFRISCLVS